MKKLLRVTNAPRPHWVGDGFPVRSLFSYGQHSEQLSPFLLLDYAGPADFTPAQQPRGVGQHPHRGFETVTIVYQGEVAHQDSTGNGGVIGPGLQAQAFCMKSFTHRHSLSQAARWKWCSFG